MVDGNHKNRGELYLEHDYAGVELDLNEAQDTLRSLHRLWKRPVHIATVLNGSQTVVSFDGKEASVDVGDEIEVEPAESEA